MTFQELVGNISDFCIKNIFEMKQIFSSIFWQRFIDKNKKIEIVKN